MITNLIIGFLLAVVYIIFILPRKSGDNPSLLITIKPIIYNSMIQLKINKETAIHIHHWVICLFLLFIFVRRANSVLWFFCLVLCMQGLMYSDSFKFITENPY